MATKNTKEQCKEVQNQKQSRVLSISLDLLLLFLRPPPVSLQSTANTEPEAWRAGGGYLLALIIHYTCGI